MDDELGGLGVGALDATTGQRTPSKSPAGRAFGTRLSANWTEKHFLQLQQGTAAVPKSAPSLSRSARKKGRLATINEATRSGKKKKDTRLPRSQQKVVDRYNDAAAFEKHYSAATSSSARKSPSPSTSTGIGREGLDYSSIGATTPSSALRSTARSVATAAASATISTSSLSITPTNAEHRGKNLIDNFNSTSSPAITIDANDKTYTPQSVKESEDGSKPWTNVTSSASSWGLAAFKLPPSSYKSEYNKSTVDNAAAKTLATPLRVLWKELGDDYRPSPADQRSSSNTTSTSMLSPSLSSKKVLFASSLVSSSSDNVKSSNSLPPPTAVAIPKEISIGPSEYAIRFPSGQLSLHLVFEPVTQTSGHMMGCGIAKISPLFYDKLKSNVFNYIPAPASSNVDDDVDGVLPPEAAVEKLTIQVNDLLVSINGIPVLSRKYDVIMEMLHDERYQHTDRIIVFRSIEKLWHSRSSTGSSSYSNHFTRRTMRHLRTGRRVATALNDDVLLCTDEDNSNNGDSVLRTWVETPTQVPLRHSRKNRLMSSVDECNNRNSIPVSNASSEDGSYVERTERRINLTTLVKDNEKEDVAEAEISSLSLMSSTSKATSVPAATKTPSYVLTQIDMDMMTMIPFSPSNVKKIMKSGGSGIKCKRSDKLSPVIREVSGTQASHTITSPDTQVTRVKLFTVASPIASTTKRSNVRRSSSKKPQLQTIDERLGDIENNVTSSTSPSPSSHSMERIGKILMGNENLGDLGSDFEHSLRLKKAVLEEIKYVYFLLFVEEKKQRSVNDRLDIKSSGSEPLVQEENDVSVEVLVMPTPSHKIMLDMKSRLDDSYSKVKELEEEVLVLKKLSTPSTDPGVRRALLTEGPMSHPLSAGRSSSNIFDIDDRFLDPKWGIIRRSDESVEISPLVNTSNYQRQSQYSLASGGVVSLTDICNDDMEHEDKEKEVMRKGYEDIVDELRSQISDLIAEANERDASHADQVRILKQQLSGKDYDAIVTTLEQRVAVIEADGDIVRIELENARSDLVKTKEEADAALKAMRDKRQAEKDEFISKCNAIESEKKECVKKLECIAAEKVEAEAQLRESNEELKRLNKRISVVVVDREAVRLELEKARLDAIKTKGVADAAFNEVLAKKDKVVSKCNAIESEKKECVEKLERVITRKEELEVQVRESNEELLRLNERITLIEADRNAVRIEVENARVEAVKAKEVADATLKALHDERQGEKDEVVSTCNAIESKKRECVEKLELVITEKEKLEVQLRETNEVLFRCKEQISFIEADRDGMRLELEETLTRFITEKKELKVQLRESNEELVGVKERITFIETDRDAVRLELDNARLEAVKVMCDADATLKALCDERQGEKDEVVSKCRAIESEKRECIEKLECVITEKEELEVQLRQTNEVLVRIKERVVFIEADRDGALLELEQARIATDIADAALKTMLDEKLAENDDLLAECNAIESEKRECIEILDHVTTEKEEVEAQLRESNEELVRLKEQVQTLSEKKSQLEMTFSATVAELAETRQATKQEMLHCHEQILTLEKQVHSLESTLEVVARGKVDMQQQLNDLDTAGLRLAYEKENLDAHFRESNDQLKGVKMQVLEERNNLNMRISTASSHVSKARETVEHQNHYASTFEEQVRYLEKTHAMEVKDMGNMQLLLKKLDAAGLRLACEKEGVEAQLKESNDQLAKVTDQVFFLSEEKYMLQLMITKTTTDLAYAEESIKLHKSEMQERESVTNEKIASLERCIEELEIERESNHIQIAQFAAANESFVNERDAWIGRLNKLEFDVSEGIVFKTEIESLSSSISLLDSKLAAAESTVNALTLDLIAKENELTCLRQESKLERESMTLQLDNLQSDTTALNEVVNELQASKNDVISRNATLVAEVSHLSEKLVESSNATQRHKDLYIDLKYKLEAAEDLLDEGDGELDHLHSECERLEKEVSDLQAIVINAEGAADNAKEECESLTNEKESIACLLNSEIKTLRERECELIEQIENAEKLHDLSSQDLMNKLAKSQDDANDRKMFITDLESKLDVATTSLAEANATIQILGLDCACLKKQANDIEIMLAVERDASSRQKETIDLLTTSLTDRRCERDSLAVDIEFKQSEIRLLSERERELSNQLDIQGKQLDISRRDALQNTALTIDLKTKLESAKHLLNQGKTEVERLEEQISNLNIVLNEKEEIVTTQADKILSLDAELSELQVEKESMAATLNNNIAEIRELSYKLQLQFEVNTTLQRKHDKQVNQLVKEIDDSLIDTNENEASAEALLANLIRLLNITKEALTHQKDENRSLKVELARVNASRDEIGSERDALVIELKLSADRIIDLEDTIVESESKIIQLETIVANLQSHYVYVSELKNDIAVLNESLIVREQEKLSLLSDLRELEVTINAETQFNSQMKMNVLQQQELVSRNNELTLTVEKISTNLHDAEAKSCRDLLSHDVARSQLMVDIRDLQNLVSATKIKLETINSDHLRVVKEKESELESKAVVIMSNKQEIVRLTNKVASLEQVLVLLESEGTTTMDAVDTTRKHFERERESLNDCIKELQLKLGESRDTAKKEESELESLREKITASNQIEHDLREKVSISQDEIKRLSDELDTVMKCHENSLSEIGEKQRSSIEEVVDELHVHKINVDQLRQRLLEETDLCSSLRDLVTVKEQTIHDQLSEIDLLNTMIKSIKQRMSDAESQFTREKQQLCSTINEQKLVQELSNQSEMRLGLMLKAMSFDYDQMVVDFSDTREAITKSIESFKLESDEVVRRVVSAFKADIFVSRREIESVSNKLSLAMKHYQEVLALKDKEIQRQEDSLQELQLQLNETTNGSEITIHDWEQEKVSYEVRLQTLQDEVDENVCLKSEIESAKLAYSDKLSTIESDWMTFQLALHQLAACIAHDDHELPIEAIPDMTTLLQTFVELFQQKLDQISTLQLQLTAQSQDNHAACDLLSKLNEMSHKLSSETSYRQLAEMKCIAAETAVADEKVRISVLEHQSKETEENALLQAKEIKSLKAQIETLKSQIDEINTKDQLLSREARDLEFRLEQAKGQKKSLELKYERSLAEIESCKKHSNDLMTIMIEKNKDVQSKEGKVLDLQYQVDDLQSKIDGWVCAFNGISSTAAEQLEFSSPDDAATNIVATSALCQDKQTADIAKLEEQCLQLKEEMRQQALMHQAIVSGLESECQSLSDECFDVNGKLKDKNDYVITLEDVKCQLMAKLDTLTKDKENLHRRLCDLQTTCNILRQQKLDAKSLSNDSKSVISAVKMLAGIATAHSSKLDGFSCTDMSLSTWSEDVDFIARFIEHMSIINQKNSLKIERVKDSIRSPKTLVIRGDDGGHDVAENSSTPKAKGRNVASAELVVVPAQHSDILKDLLCVKNSITSIMSSTKLSTSKKVRRGEMKDAVCDDDLYTDLLNAHDQLKSLSSKIEAMTADRRNYESRISELEQENEKIIMMARGSPLDVAAISSSDERMKVGALLLSNMQQRHNRLLLQNAFKTWNSKVHMCKQVSIAKDMAKELIKTRNTVLLLKSQMEIE